MALRYFISRAYVSTTRYIHRYKPIQISSLSTIASGAIRAKDTINPNIINQQEWDDISINYCYDRISTISKSWTAAMSQLPNYAKNNNLRDCAVIHLLLGRCLDTIEDDAHLASEDKIKLLSVFCELLEFENIKIDNIEKVIELDTMFTGIGGNDEDIELLENLSKILHFFYSIKNVEME
eukprot:328392_1